MVQLSGPLPLLSRRVTSRKISHPRLIESETGLIEHRQLDPRIRSDRYLLDSRDCVIKCGRKSKERGVRTELDSKSRNAQFQSATPYAATLVQPTLNAPAP